MYRPADFKCIECGVVTEFDVCQEDKVCPECKGDTKRVYNSAPVAVLKGSGWTTQPVFKGEKQ